MGISTKELIRMKKWTLLLSTIQEGSTRFGLKSLEDAKSLRTILNRENRMGGEFAYKMTENKLAIEILKKRREENDISSTES